ncbi:hypothetical protein CASFOL_009183 [Castilleja foliolosa]|uniref:Uncharacterized protein n=1 Tax=Castilleja foliolosa TaxID=1961234 RepID=A0ABD3DYY7_9LAMI
MKGVNLGIPGSELTRLNNGKSSLEHGRRQTGRLSRDPAIIGGDFNGNQVGAMIGCRLLQWLLRLARFFDAGCRKKDYALNTDYGPEGGLIIVYGMKI